jgi:hypothetical protein
MPNMTEKSPISPSPEAEILRQIEALIRKVATDQATARDMQLLQDLQKVRVNLMRPKILVHKASSKRDGEGLFKAYA